jgi:hypothetical protein
MTLTLTPGEQAVYDEALGRRSEKFQKPYWMERIRATQIKLALRKALADMPREESGGSLQKVLYTANRRIVVLNPNGTWNRPHDADVDGLPICIMRGFVERAQIEHPDLVKELGGGPVTCGHCANARNR